MPRRFYDEQKMDIGLLPQTLNNANATGNYFNLALFQELTVLLLVGAMAAGNTSKIELLQAKDDAGSGSKVIVGASATITANELVTVATVALATVANTDVVTINGFDFTKAAATAVANREFADAAGLVTCVNDDAYGVKGVSASVNGTTVTLIAEDPGETVITTGKAENAGTITLATTQALAFVNIKASNLDLANDYSHVAAKVTTTGNTIVAAQILRGVARYRPDQKVAASAAL